MSAILTLDENNEYSPAINRVDANNDVPNNQLANRTLYLKLSLEELQKFFDNLQISTNTSFNNIQKTLKDMSQDITDLQTTSANIDANKILKQLSEITDNLNNLQTNFNTHKHKYAGSSKEGGDANTINVLNDVINTSYVIGSADANTNKLRRNTNIFMEGETLTAPIFSGTLEGVASSALTLENEPIITLSGAVVGSAKFKGDTELVINCSLPTQTLNSGTIYGSTGSQTLRPGNNFQLPSISISETGLVTKLSQNSITLSSDIAIKGITSATKTERKLFILGATSQTNEANVYTQTGVYIDNHFLYSNGYKVVDTETKQNIINKTYEGYELKEACSRAVDDSITGFKNDNRLVTSHALYSHEHKYAMSDEINGKAKYLSIKENDKLKCNILGNNNSDGTVVKNTNISFNNKLLSSPQIEATEKMFIPGGRIWIDSVETAVDDTSWLGDAIVTNSSIYAEKTRAVHLANNLIVNQGQLLAYKKGGYVLADNKEIETINNIVLVYENSNNDIVSVIDTGEYDLYDYSHDGEDVYVGENGEMIFDIPNNYVKKIGYMEGSVLIFRPHNYSIKAK